MARRKAKKQVEKDTTPVNAAGHWIYLRSNKDDPYASGDAHTRGFAPGEKVRADGNEVLQREIDRGLEEGWLVGHDDYEAGLPDYETTPSDRPEEVASVSEAVAAGNASLAPAGGKEDGPPPPGDAPGFGFEGAISAATVTTPPAPAEASDTGDSEGEE